MGFALEMNSVHRARLRRSRRRRGRPRRSAGQPRRSAGRVPATSCAPPRNISASQSTSCIGGGAMIITAGADPPGPVSLPSTALAITSMESAMSLGRRGKAQLEIIGPQHEDDEIQRHVRFERDRQSPQAVLVAALDRVVAKRRPARMPLLDDLPSRRRAACAEFLASACPARSGVARREPASAPRHRCSSHRSREPSGRRATAKSPPCGKS